MIKIIDVDSGDFPVVDISHCRNAKEATEMLINATNPCIVVDESDHAQAMEQPEHIPKFAIGDVVRVRRSLLKYLGIKDDERTMVVYGVKKLPHCDFDCYAYDCTHGRDECCFIGNELELVRKAGEGIRELE